MSQSYKYQEADERISEKFRKRIQQNIEDAQNECFSSHIIEHIPAVVIKVKLNRAVFEYALIFRDYVLKFLGTNHKNFILDFSETIFLDSTFLGSIIFFNRKLRSMNGSLRLVIDSNKMTLLSQINNFSDVFELFASVDESILNFEE